MHHLQSPLIANRPELQDYCVLEIEAPQIAAAAVPGQFVHVRVGCDCDPLLRRPISIMLTEKHTGMVRLLVKRVGRGTEMIAQMTEGTLDVMGPLGQGFALPAEGKDILMVAGGVGVAPLIFLADALQTARGHYRVRGLYGGATADHLPLWTDFGGRCEEFYVTTEDGSAGEQGLVTDLLQGQLQRGDVQAVYTCGPRPMMAKVAATSAAAGIPCFASLEQWMGCGVGACMGCVVPATRSAGVSPAYLRVCKDGPVFDAAEIDWGRL
jgi:dihydroorotate dehydrogenase electron transfer subunit